MNTDMDWAQQVVLAAVVAGEDINYLPRTTINARAPQGAAGITLDNAYQLAQRLQHQGLVTVAWSPDGYGADECTATATDAGRAALATAVVAGLRRTLTAGGAASATITSAHPDHSQGYTGHYQVHRITDDQHGTWLHCTQHPDDDGEHAGMAATIAVDEVLEIRLR